MSRNSTSTTSGANSKSTTYTSGTGLWSTWNTSKSYRSRLCSTWRTTTSRNCKRCTNASGHRFIRKTNKPSGRDAGVANLLAQEQAPFDRLSFASNVLAQQSPFVGSIQSHRLYLVKALFYKRRHSRRYSNRSWSTHRIIWL